MAKIIIQQDEPAAVILLLRRAATRARAAISCRLVDLLAETKSLN
jgi:hypothetical protein